MAKKNRTTKKTFSKARTVKSTEYCCAECAEEKIRLLAELNDAKDELLKFWRKEASIADLIRP